MPSEFHIRKAEIENVRARVKEILARALQNSPVRKIHAGFIDNDPDAPGKYSLIVATNTGIERYTRAELVEDNQVTSSTAHAHRNRSFEPCDAPKPWEVLRNPHSDLEAMTRALDELCDKCSEDVARFAADELGRNDLSEAWREHLIYVVEDIVITDAENRQRLRERLIEIARILRNSPKAGVERIVWSAIRRAVSLSTPGELAWLLDFMTLQGPVDTRLVAIQCVSRKFEAAQPPESPELEVLESRVADFAKKYLDPDVFTGGGNAAIAMNAVVAMAAMGSRNLVAVLETVRQLQKRWFVRQLSQKFERLVTARDSRGRPAIECKRLQELMESLDAMAAN